MDKYIEADIQKHFFKEYLESAVKTQRGLMGKFSRWSEKPTTRRTKVALGMAFVAAIAVPIAAFAAGGLMLGATVAVSFSGGGALLAAIAALPSLRAEISAAKALNKDIENGTLITRYKDEVLQPRLQEIQREEKEIKSQLSEQTAKPDFTAAADAAPAAAATKKKHWYKRNPSPTL